MPSILPIKQAPLDYKESYSSIVSGSFISTEKKSKFKKTSILLKYTGKTKISQKCNTSKVNFSPISSS